MKKPTVTPPPALLEMGPGQRRFLFLTAAITGAAIMVVEILGAKMLAPYIGTSHFVWTAQIAVTLIALAAGYYGGGKLVDRRPNLRWLYGAILLAGIYLCGAVVVVEPLAYWCLTFKLALGSLLASAFLFFIPLALLAMVGPFLVRVLTLSLQQVGGSMGRLTALSTLGSFAGTMLIGYLLIPFFPNITTMILTASLLIIISVVYLWAWGGGWRKSPAPLLGVASAALLAWLGLQAHSAHRDDMVELHRCNSNFGLLQVLQRKDGPQRLYLNDYLTQNGYDTNSHQSIYMFTYMLHDLARAYAPRLERVLCIGLGIGIVPMQFAREGARVDAVEINPSVVPLARDFFELQPDKINIVIGDGRWFVNQARQLYDAVILDAFLGESSPSHLMTQEAFAAMRRILKPEGVLVINCFGDLQPGKDFLVASLEKTIKKAFGNVRIHSEPYGGNVFFVASASALQARGQPDFDSVHPICRWRVQRAYENVVESDPSHGMVLTDNYNPVEFYDADNREQIRRNLALSMRTDDLVTEE